MAGLLGFPSPKIIQEDFEGWSPNPEDHLGQSILPLNSEDFNEDPTGVSWDIKSPGFGMTQPSGIDADPELVKQPGFKNKRSGTAHWADKGRLNHSDLLLLRGYGPDWRRRKANDKVAGLQNHLQTRAAVRMESLIWTALRLGAIQINSAKVKINVDYEIPAAHKWTVNVLWTDLVNSDPMADLALVPDKFEGDGCRPKWYVMNSRTVRLLAQNVKTRDLVKQSPLVDQIGLKNIGPLVAKLAGIEGDIIVYDAGFLNDSKTFERFIPDNVVIVIGEGIDNLKSDPLGYLASTPDLRNGGYENPMGGVWVVIKDRTQREDNPYWEMSIGFAALPIIFRPYWIQVITVG